MKIKLSQIIRMFKFCFGYLFLAAAVSFFVWALNSIQLTGLSDFAVLVVIALVHGSLGVGLLKGLLSARYCAAMYCIYVAFCIYLAQPKIYSKKHLTLEFPFALPLCFLAIGLLIWWPESWLVKKIDNEKLV